MQRMSLYDDGNNCTSIGSNSFGYIGAMLMRARKMRSSIVRGDGNTSSTTFGSIPSFGFNSILSSVAEEHQQSALLNLHYNELLDKYGFYATNLLIRQETRRIMQAYIDLVNVWRYNTPKKQQSFVGSKAVSFPRLSWSNMHELRSLSVLNNHRIKEQFQADVISILNRISKEIISPHEIENCVGNLPWLPFQKSIPIQHLSASMFAEYKVGSWAADEHENYQICYSSVMRWLLWIYEKRIDVYNWLSRRRGDSWLRRMGGLVILPFQDYAKYRRLCDWLKQAWNHARQQAWNARGFLLEIFPPHLLLLVIMFVIWASHTYG